MLIFVSGAVVGGCVLLIFVITLVWLCCRHIGKGELNGQYGREGHRPILSHSIHIQAVSAPELRAGLRASV